MRDGRLLLLAPALAVLAGVFAAPAALLLVVSFWSVRSFKLTPDLSGAAWARFATEYGGLAAYTVGVGLAVGALCTVLGFLFAYAARFKAGAWGDALMLATLVTLFGGYLVKVYAWKSILGASGILNQGLMALGLTDAPLAALIYSPFAVAVALVHFLLPFAILPIYAALRSIPDVSIEAARDLGAGWWAILGRVILPQAQGGILAAFGFCFLLAAGDYVTPLLLGGPSGQMLGQFVLLEFTTRFDWPAGAAMSFGLLALCLAALALVAGLWRLSIRPGGP